MAKPTSKKVSGFSDRLRAAVADESIASFAKRAGVADSLFRKYLSDDSLPGMEKLLDIASAGGVRPEWLFTGEEPMRPGGDSGSTPDNGVYRGKQPTELATSGEYLLIPRHDVMVAAGDAVLLPVEEIVDFILFRKDFLRRELGVDPKNAVGVQAKGDSMKPVIADGELLLVDVNQLAVHEDGIHVINLEGRVMVKRLQFMLGGTI